MGLLGSERDKKGSEAHGSSGTLVESQDKEFETQINFKFLKYLLGD